jgi:ornithine carbamoyltransferase
VFEGNSMRNPKRDFLRVMDLGSEELNTILDLADAMKRDRTMRHSLEGHSVALIFEKSSTRTRVSFEVGVHELGGHAVVLSSKDTQLGRGESLEDTARTLSGYVRAIVCRTFEHTRIETLARFAKVPVVNALTDGHHPCQILADLQTVRELRGPLHALRYAWVGDGNNVARSWVEAARVLGLRLTLASPKGYELPASELSHAIVSVRDPKAAVEGADVVITDVWASMGQETEAKARAEAFAGYKVDPALMRHADREAMVLHCLPAHRGEEIDAVYLDGPSSVVWREAENRLHAQKALLEWLLE